MNSQVTKHNQEQKEWIRKLISTLMPKWFSTPSPYQRSLRYKAGIEHALEDDGKFLFNLPETLEYPNAIKMPTILYSRSKVWEEQIYTDLNRHYLKPEDYKRYVKSFASLMRRYRKEYRKHYLLKYIKPQARYETTRCILYKETQLPQDIINNIVSYFKI
jgi:hypothetical protein